MNYKLNVKQLVVRLLLLVVIYQVCRLGFYLYNKSFFPTVGVKEFLGGFRFDLVSIFLSNSLLIVFSLVPGNFKYKKGYQKFLKVLYFIVNLLFISTNIIDFEYYKFTGGRSTFALITASGMRGDILRLIPAFIKDFWPLFLGFFLFIWIFWKLIPTYKFNPELKNNSVKGWIFDFLTFIIFGGLIVLMGRGGFQRAPIRAVDAVDYTHNLSNTSVVLNTPFTIFKTLDKKDDLKKLSYFEKGQLEKIYTPVLELKSPNSFNKKNIVILILESFGKENIHLQFGGKKVTPFLDSLITQSHYFSNAYANGYKSIDAVPSTITSIPSLMEVSYILSNFSFNKIDGFTNILKKEGYYTAFFHGAFNGSQNFTDFAKIASYDKYYGKNEYPGTNPEAFDGYWGIFDEDFLQFAVKEFGTFKQPFFSTIFTISSHNPYIIPKKYKNKFPKGDRVILESIAYTDYSLKKFFQSAAKQPWYKNTIFVLTSDHTSRDDKKKEYFNNQIGLSSIPILIFDPSNPENKKEDKKLFQQIDILPEVLSYLNYNGSIVSFGNLPESQDRMVANYKEGIYHFIMNDYFINYDGNRILDVFNYKTDSLLKKSLNQYPKDKMETKIKAYLQQYNNRLIDNNLSVLRKK